MKKTYLTLLLPLLIALVLAAQVAVPAIAVPAQQANLLVNASFEDPYNGGAANGWARWHNASTGDFKPAECSDTYFFQPLWSRETNPALVVDGSISQHIGNQYDTWHAGVMQDVAVTPGATYRFTFRAIGRASNEQYPAPSDTAVNLGVRAGIDPNGSGLWYDDDVVWGGSGSPHDGGDQSNWQQFSVETTAAGNVITVFASANVAGAYQCRAHLDVWFDNAQLIEAAPPPTNTPLPQPTLPPATNTPVRPTATNTPDVTATTTLEPTETSTNTPEPPTGGTICVNAFADENSNGQHEESEGSMAGVTFTIVRDGEVAAQGISTGPQPICFDELEAGSYQVAQTVPATLEMTTGANTEISLNEGQTIRIEFGSRVRPEEEVSTNPSSTTVDAETELVDDALSTEAEESGFGSSLLAMSGLAALLLGVIMAGVLLFLVLRQRS